MVNNQIIEWDECILECQHNIWMILTSTIEAGYMHKILTQDGLNVYLVSEDFIEKKENELDHLRG